MSINLYKVSPVLWVVEEEGKEAETFKSIELASSYLLDVLSIDDDEIDFAVIEMTAHGHTHAQFGVKGKFIFSDDEKINLGSA